MADPDAFQMAEGGEAALDRLIEGGPPKAARRGRPGNPKAAWEQTNIRLNPTVKRRLRDRARNLGVPLEEVVHFGLSYFLENLDAGQVDLPEPKPATTRMTLLEMP